MIAQSKLGYGAMIVGIDDAGAGGSFVSNFVEEILAELHIPIVLVRGARNQDGRLPGIFARALVPVIGSQSSRAAQELACNMSSRLGTEVLFSHIVYSPDEARSGGLRSRQRGSSPSVVEKDGSDVAERVLQQAARHAEELRANYKTEVRFAVSPGDEILRQAVQSDSDLIVLGSELRQLEGRAFLGQNVEYILRNAVQTVVVAISPDTRPS
jgi:nucleotide-binding universal stress UspA family protein